MFVHAVAADPMSNIAMLKLNGSTRQVQNRSEHFPETLCRNNYCKCLVKVQTAMGTSIFQIG